MPVGNEYDRANAATRLTPGTHSTASEEYRAALYVCGRAKDQDDAALLLEALGLVDSGVRWTTTNPNGRRKKVTG